MKDNRQTSLFDDYEGVPVAKTTDVIKVFRVKENPKDSPSLRKLKRNFNHRIRAITKLKEEMERLPKVFAFLNKKFHEIVKPAEEALLESKIALIEVIDRTYGKKSFSENERVYIRSYMQRELNDLSEMGYEYDEKFRKYFQLDQLAGSEESMALMQEMINNMLGMDIDIKDLVGDERLSPEEFREKYEEEMREKKSEGKNQKKKREETGGADLHLHFMKTYKGLAKKIHPDLEQNEAIKKEKEKLMQELAHAKDNHDLFQLMAIKLKIDKIENSEMVLDENYLELYADRLLEQKKALEMDIFIMKNKQGQNSWLYQRFHAPHHKTTEKRMKSYREELALQTANNEGLARSMKTVAGMKKCIHEMMDFEDEMFWI